MANQEHLDQLKQGSFMWNRWLELHPGIQLDLFAANLSGANLFAANLSGADLSHAILSEAILNEAYLLEAYLLKANITGANLSEANLRGADLSDAILSGTKLTGATLSEANLSRARRRGTIFADVDLSTVKGLTTVQHLGPSSIGIDTIFRSQGRIPERFLRDAGIPDTFLDYIHSLVEQAIQYFTCFISHSHHDQHFCDRLYADLRHHDVPSWYFPEDATWGKSVWGEIDRSIKLYDKLVA